MQDKAEEERTVFCELHSAGVNTTTFMAKQGVYKYIHVTGHPPQLYNLSDDPKEWHNLAGNPDFSKIENRLRAAIMEQFDPEGIEQSVQKSLARRKVIREAMQTTGGPKWDYQPYFDATQQYWREG